jgi:hypothetical protein
LSGGFRAYLIPINSKMGEKISVVDSMASAIKAYELQKYPVIHLIIANAVFPAIPM